jgi:hypothetical protein
MLLQDGPSIIVAAASQSSVMVLLLAHATCIFKGLQPRRLRSSVLTCQDRLQDKMAVEVSYRPACTPEQHQSIIQSMLHP